MSPPTLTVQNFVWLDLVYGVDYADAVSVRHRAEARLRKDTVPGARDLTVEKVEAFNRRVGHPPAAIEVASNGLLGLWHDLTYAPYYFSISADADQDGSGGISPGELAPYCWVKVPLTSICALPVNLWIANTLYDRLADVHHYNLKETVQNGKVVRELEPVAGEGRLLNDLAVTMDSARHPGFREVGQYQLNHQSVRGPAIGRIVADNVRMIQPIR